MQARAPKFPVTAVATLGMSQAWARSCPVTAALEDNGVFTEKTVVLQQSFKYFVPPKALKPYKKLQKCQKLLANLGSEDTVEPPKNYQAKVPGTVSRTKKSANFSRPQVKHFLGCKKSTKSNTCGSLFTCSGALLF